jgi:predicted DNA-binding protein
MEKLNKIESVRLSDTEDEDLKQISEVDDRPVSYEIRKAIRSMILARGDRQGKHSLPGKQRRRA